MTRRTRHRSREAGTERKIWSSTGHDRDDDIFFFYKSEIGRYGHTESTAGGDCLSYSNFNVLFGKYYG